MDFSLAIDDNLAEELCKFKSNQQCDVDKVQKTLHYYKSYPIFTQRYFTKYYTDKTIQRNLIQSNSSINWASIETVSKNTLYKIILSSKENVNFPYVSIYDDAIENNFTATFLKDDGRQKTLEHLKSLLENAECVFIYDNYLESHNVWLSFVNFAKECFPKKQLKIFYPQGIKLTEKQCTQIKGIGNSKWSFKSDKSHTNFSKLHDRYLIIDDKVEVILTSGIDNLMNASKDFTYIVRRHRK